MDLFKPLRQLYPSYMLEIERANTVSAIVGACVFFVLFILKPFGMELMPLQIRFRDASIYSIIAAVFCRIKLLVIAFLLKKQIFIEEKWTVGNEILLQIWFLFSLGIVNWVVGHFIYNSAFTFLFFYCWQKETFTVGIFPVMSLVFIRQYNLLKKYTSMANAMEAKLSIATIRAVPIKNKAMQAVLFTDETSQDNIPIAPPAILYIVAADNYIRIYYLENNAIKTLLLRSTLKRAEERLAGNENFYRCHRSYLVNLNYIRHISGNATGYKLHLEGTSDLVPVSRSLNNEITEKINTILVA